MLVLLFFELSIRVYFAITEERKSIIWRPQTVLENYYPGIYEALSKDTKIENEINILFLGASVIHPYWGAIEKELENKIIANFSCKVNITNVAIPAHTSLDSKIKYNLLQNQHYDIVLLYHGINELRFNNCPPSVFDVDYKHVKFYNYIHAINNPISRFSIFPYAINAIKVGWIDRSENDFLPMNEPKKKWLELGANIKSATSFQKNYQAIIEQAHQNNTDIIIPSFAYSPAKAFSKSFIEENKLNADHGVCPIEIWGEKEAIVKGLKIHNETIKKYLAKKTNINNNIHTVSMHDSLTTNENHFHDICHLSPQGVTKYVSIIFPIFKQIIDEKEVCITSN